MEKYYDHIFSSIPDSIDFGFITVKSESERVFHLENESEVTILFEIQSKPDFTFEPTNGIIPRKKTFDLKVKITPQFAKVIISNAKITLDNKASKVIKLSSIAKFPYLRLQKNVLDFGILQIGQSKEMEIIVMNTESVPATFQISKQSVQPGKTSEVFFILNLKDEIPPSSNYLIKVLYRPNFPSISSNDTYELKTIGGNQVTFTLTGFCSPLSSHLGAKFVNFKSIPLGQQMTKLIRVYNDSDMTTEYQIYHENSGAFSITKTQDVIPPKSNVRINITFHPYETLIYYDRVYCVIKNHIVMSLDLYGSCHDLLTKMPILEQKYIDFFRYKIIKGCYFDRKIFPRDGSSGEIIDKLSLPNSNSNNNLNIKTISNIPEETTIDYSSQIQLHKEMFWDYTSENRIISFDVDHIDFNYIECGTVSEPYILHVHNNSNEVIKVKWIYDKPVATSNLVKGFNIFNVDSTVFFVQPEDMIINKKGSGEFKVYFKPNKPEYYFYSDLPCLGTIIPSNQDENCKNNIVLKGINKEKLSETGKGLVTQSIDLQGLTNANNENKSMTFKSGLFKSLSLNKRSALMNNSAKGTDYMDPPIPIKISMVGHSFPPGSQIFMPMFELLPKKEIFFPPTTIKQSLYQTMKISNKSDTPLFYKLSTDPSGIFRVHRKYGLIPANEFHLICVEFCPKEPTVYRFPLRIVFNHDSRNLKTIILNGLCTDPVIKLEGISNEIYFPPTFVGIKTSKVIEIRNLSPIKINVNIQLNKTNDAYIEVIPSSFSMDKNATKKLSLNVCPLMNSDIMSSMTVTAERVYDPINEEIGIYNPGSSECLKAGVSAFDRRTFSRTVTLIAKGSDGDINVQPSELDMGTVKVGFNKKSVFSIYNPSMTNFYIKLVPEFDDPSGESKGLNVHEAVSLDFYEGLLNSFCQKEITVTFKPLTRINLSVKIKIYASDNTKGQYLKLLNQAKAKDSAEILQINNNPNINEPTANKNNLNNIEEEETKTIFKCSINIRGRGDYPLVKIVDLRNTQRSISHLWKNFHVDEANEELQKKLTSDEINYMSNIQSSKKNDIGGGLKCIKFDFGKYIYKYSKTGAYSHEDVYLTLKNEGGVPSEFYFKFPDDIIIKREIWMDPIEPSSNDKVEYHVLKENIFEIEPRKAKLEPNETCNIRLRYNIKEPGEHRLRVIFQVVNGKPLIFELNSESISEKVGFLDIVNPVLDFDYIPIGYMSYIASPVELNNISAARIKYKVDENQIKEFNETNGNVEIFKVKKGASVINAGETNFIIVYFRPLTDKFYKMDLNIYYTDEKKEASKTITIQGRGYHPLKVTPPKQINPYEGLSSYPVCNVFNGETIQKCGFSLEELDFGELNDTKSKTLILYNYSLNNSFNFDIIEPDFLVDDLFSAFPNKGVLEPNSHKIIKISLTPGQQISKYEGDLKIKILWNSNEVNTNKRSSLLLKSLAGSQAPVQGQNQLGNNILNPLMSMAIGQKKVIKTENLYIRIIKRCVLRDIPGHLEPTVNNYQSFVERILSDITREIICDKEFDDFLTKGMDSQSLGIYEWTNDINYTTLEDARNEYLNNVFNHATQNTHNDSSATMTKRGNISSFKYTKVSKTQLDKEKEEMKEKNKPKIDFGEKEDNAIQDKYMQEMIDKYNATVQEVNEKLIVVNEDTRKLISDTIMENTIFNIVNDAVSGQSDLTEKPRIYFFINGEDKNNINVNKEVSNNNNS